MKHLAIFRGDGAEQILLGKKSMESRFSKSKIAPFKVISSGDLVYIKPSGREIIGQFRARKVIFFDNLDLKDLSYLRQKYAKELAVSQDYWKGKENCKFATLIFIGSSTRFITSPVKIPKKDLRGWVVLN